MSVRQEKYMVKNTLESKGRKYYYYDLQSFAKSKNINLNKFPFSLKILLENLLRNNDGISVKDEDIDALVKWQNEKKSDHEIAFYPARVLCQDFTGVPAVVDLAAMRDAVAKLGGDAKKINPIVPVDLVIDHSVQVDYYGDDKAFDKNVDLEMQRNKERYEFLKWGQKSFNNFRVVPPGTGICHQVNLEYLAKVVWSKDVVGKDGSKETVIYPDSLVGTDSHTTMVNGLSVLGWGVGGIEAEAVMLGQSISMIIPEVIGVRLIGKLKEGVTATDLVLTITHILRKKGVVGKFVEFYGEGVKSLSLADRATIANMAPEYGATCGFFPVDEQTIKYLKDSARDEELIELVELYSKKQGLWYDGKNDNDILYTEILELDMSTIESTLAGPKRPQDKVLLKDAKNSFVKLTEENNKNLSDKFSVAGSNYQLQNGSVVIAAITSCTNTSNPSVMLAAGLVAKKASELGIKVKPWVKTSLAPGSQVVSEYLNESGLQNYLDKIGFNLVGYGCTSCIGNSGPLIPEIEETIKNSDLLVTSVLSGNRNFEGRVHPLTKANYLASPPLVVIYALAGNMNIDVSKDEIAINDKGRKIYLKDLWPSNQEIADAVAKFLNPSMFRKRYSSVFDGDKLWQNIKIEKSDIYKWDDNSTYIKNPPYFTGMTMDKDAVKQIKNARILALLGDSITTDHISPAGSISSSSPAASYLKEKGVEPRDFNSYGARRGNHEVMMRGTFANIRIKNELAGGKEGGYTKYLENNDLVSAPIMSIYDAAMKYQNKKTDLVVIAGKEYGTGSSRDWAAKGTLLQGIKAVIAESFERIHRSNLVGMGILPLTFTNEDNRISLGLKGNELIDIDFADDLKIRSMINCKIKYDDGKEKVIQLLCRIDTEVELENYKNGGILKTVIRKLAG